MDKQSVQLGKGYTIEDLKPGDRFVTNRRTITESDLIAFISTTGMLETIFIDTTKQGAMPGRPIPGTLTHCFIEGMILQTLFQGTGLALLETRIEPRSPVCVGDSIHGEIVITKVQKSTKPGRGVVTSNVLVVNQRGGLVMSYEAVRLIASNEGSDS